MCLCESRFERVNMIIKANECMGFSLYVCSYACMRSCVYVCAYGDFVFDYLQEIWCVC